MSEVHELGVVQAVVCEDEPLARRAMENYLKDVAWIEVVAIAGDGRESLRLINKHEPDLVFLDVRMPGMSGVEVLEALDHRPAIVFTTAFDEYAIQAFEHGAVDYLVKPFGRERLIRTLDRVRVRLVGEARARRNVAVRSGDEGRPEPGVGQGARANEGSTVGSSSESIESAAGAVRYLERLFAKHRGSIVPLPVGEILHLEAVDGGVEVHTTSGTLSMDTTLSEVESRLDPNDFVRVHRGHVVNLSRVKGFKRYDDRRMLVNLEDGTRIVASRAGSKALRSMIE